MKKIALITDGWRRYVTYAWVDGITRRSGELGVDLSLFVFNTNGNLSHDEKYNQGEYGLYDLPDYDSYDGFIFDCTNTIDVKVIESIVEKLKAAPGPVVSISYYVDGFHYVGNDNKTLIREMIDHMYYHHGCRNMVFAGGPENNFENMQRFEAFVEAHSEYNLPISPDNYMFGEYDYDTGVRYITEWLASGRPFPDVFICANDNIAAGMCAEAEKRGYLVPRDFKVTGFDNLDKAAYYKPQIATVEHNRGFIGGRALDILLRLIDGEEVDEYTYLSSKIVPAETCGCANTGSVDYRIFAKWQIDAGVSRDRHEENLLDLEKRFAECRTIHSLIDSFAEYVKTLDCAGMFMFVDRKLIEADPDAELSVSGYDLSEQVIVYAGDEGKRLYSIRTTRDLTDYLNSFKRSRHYMFFPIHFRDSRVGATVLAEPFFLYDNPFFYDVHTTFTDRLHNLYIQTKLSNATTRMQLLYNRDVLTGLYNRSSYYDMIAPAFDGYRQEGAVCAMVFFDVDYFKQINDTYGHDFGDRVLIKIANTVRRLKPKDSYAYRFGGDEFVVFVPYAYENKTDRFVAAVDRELSSCGIGISCGVIMTDPSSEAKLDDYLVMADERMYEVKKEHKQNNKSLGEIFFGTKRHSEIEIIDEPSGRKFFKGVDISSLPEREDAGYEFKDMDGTVLDPFDLLEKYGVNSVRLRIWNEPSNVPESGGYCDLEHTLSMARRIREHGMHFMLDFHYSDYWADPAKQHKPAAWEDLDFDTLTEAVYGYTHEVLVELSKIDALPDMVQIGNEIRSGMLFPDGAVPDYEHLAILINAGIRAVRDLSEDIKVMIHLDQGGRFFYLRDWFDAMFGVGMEPIDAIGISFYSFWHGTFADLKDSMKQLIERYDIPVYVVETAHPWRHCEGEHVSSDMMKMAGFAAGCSEQKKSLELIMQIASETSGEHDTGVYYWEPLCVTDGGFGTWDENMGMLNASQEALEAFEAFRDFDPAHPSIGDMDAYIAELYRHDDAENVPAGTNLIPNGDLKSGNSGWWTVCKPDDITLEFKDGEAYFSSQCNFTFEMAKELRINKPGRYLFSVEYRGTNTTGVEVKMFLKYVTCNGETVYTEPVYPSDVGFVKFEMDPIELEEGFVQVGIQVSAPPVFGRVRNFRLEEL